MAEWKPPWTTGPLSEWTICGMNHYRLKGEQFLFVSMTRNGRCITEEGKDDEFLWNRLCHQAWAENDKAEARVEVFDGLKKLAARFTDAAKVHHEQATAGRLNPGLWKAIAVTYSECGRELISEISKALIVFAEASGKPTK